MWLDSLAPLSGSRQGEEREAERDADEGDEHPPPPVVSHRHDEAEDQDAHGLAERVGEVVPAEDPAPPLGRVGVRQVRVVHGVVDPVPHRGDEVEEGEGPDVGREPHQRGEDREDDERDAGHDLAAAAVRPQREGHRPEQLRHRPDEGHRAERGVVHVERVLEVVADERDAVVEGARHEGRGGEQHERRVAVATEDPDQGGRLAFARAGHHGEVRDVLTRAGLRHDLGQQLIRDGEVEHHLVGHRDVTLTSPGVAGSVVAGPRPPPRRGYSPMPTRALATASVRSASSA